MFQKVVKSARLISLPDIYFRLKELTDSPDFNMAEIALLVGNDPGMAARFLRAVNSPLNRRENRIETVTQAVSLLGIRQIHDIVLRASVAKAFEGLETEVVDMQKFWHRSVLCALLTRKLALECDIMESDRFIVIGLLHDIGHLFMYISIPQEARQAIFAAREQDKPLYLIERELLGFDYAKVGGYIMKEWNLPESLQTTTWLHPEPSRADKFELETSLLHLAYLLVHSELEDGSFGAGAYAIDPAALQLTGLTAERCLAVRETAAGECTGMAESILI